MPPDRFPLHVFSKKELEGCDDGACSQCGVCCDVLNVTVPDPSAPLDITRSIRKRAGERCPFLTRSGEGLYVCDVHHLKGSHPFLQDCGNFTGKDTEQGYIFMLEKKREQVLGPQTREQAELALEWFSCGILQDIDLSIQSTADFFCVLNYLELLGRIPHELFEAMRVKETIMEWMKEPTFKDMLTKTGIHPNAGDLHGEFFRAYVSPALSIAA